MKKLFAQFKSAAKGFSPMLTLDVAHAPQELANGLMFRAVLPQHTGMLFVFGQPGHHHFWMHNTGIPLDIAWLSGSGVVQQMAKLQPYNERVVAPNEKALYAIELNAGALEQYGVRVGDRLLIAGVTT